MHTHARLTPRPPPLPLLAAGALPRKRQLQRGREGRVHPLQQLLRVWRVPFKHTSAKRSSIKTQQPKQPTHGLCASGLSHNTIASAPSAAGTLT